MPDTSAEPPDIDAGLLLLNEAISIGRKTGMAGQHLDAMCTARDDIVWLRDALMDANLKLMVAKQRSPCRWWWRLFCLAPVRACGLDWQCVICHRTTGLYGLNSRKCVTDA
jgi:hypothetical protein